MSEPVATLWRQIQEVRATYVYAVVGIRVTDAAIRGSVAAMPVSPERERVLRERLDPNRAEGSAGLYEILVHPDDWRDLLVSKKIRPYLDGNERPTAVLGLPVVEAPRV